MTPRERVLAAIDHKESDKVPLDLGATPSSGISAVAHNKLKRHLGLEALPTRVYDVVQQLAQPEEPILDCFGIDAIDIGRAFNTEEAAWRETRLEDGSAAQYPSWFRPVRQADGSWVAFSRDGTPLAKMPAGGMFYDQIYFPYLDGYPADYKGLPEAMSKVMWAAFPVSPWDHAEEENFWEELRRRALELRQSSDRALMMGAGCNLFEWGTFLRRIDNFLADLVTQPREVERLLDALMEVHPEAVQAAA